MAGARHGGASGPKSSAGATRSNARPRKSDALARHVWGESLDPRGTWVEEYLGSRGLFLPTDPEILLRTLQFHPHLPVGQRHTPALLCAFTPIERWPTIRSSIRRQSPSTAFAGAAMTTR